MPTVKVVCADITTLAVDAIVNAAHPSLLGGGGVDGAIHEAAGPELLQACRKLGGCRVGDAKITPGFRLEARYVIHAVGPVWRGGTQDERALLASCYQRSLQIAFERDLASVAFPSISTGAYGFPPELAAPIAVRTVLDNATPKPREVIFCCFSDDDLETYRKVLHRHREERP